MNKQYLKPTYSDTLMPGFSESSSLYSFVRESEQYDALQAQNDISSTVPTLLYDKKIDERFESLNRKIAKVEKIITETGPQVASAKIYNLSSDKYTLNEPIDVILKFEVDEVIAVIPELELQTDGYNEIEAINELKMELLDLFDTLNETEDNQLHTVPQSWKKTINKLISHAC